jgi:predicted ATPase
VLRKDNWNDYSYTTYFQAFFFPEIGEMVELGNLRIMYLGQKKGEATFSENVASFDSLAQYPKPYCSLGESIEYYQALAGLSGDVARDHLVALCDASYSHQIRDTFENDPCFRTSLLRYSSAVEVLDSAGQIFGVQRDRANQFGAKMLLEGAADLHEINFDFRQQQGLPHRINVLVGLNGVGKTQVMARLAMLLSKYSSTDVDREQHPPGNAAQLQGEVEQAGILDPVPSIYSVISISFSAFDSFELPTDQQSERFRYTYCGLRKRNGGLRDEADLLQEIVRIVGLLDEQKRQFLIEELPSLVHVEDIEDFIRHPEKNSRLYSRLSAGQRIALNIICHTAHNIRERSLVLFDEPEMHLHPKLMTTMMSVLGFLLEKFDSFAIVATHSPIIVQQVPSRFISVLQRHGMQPSTLRPSTECFGDNLTEIARNVFNAVESDRDYEHILDKLLLNNGNDAEEVERLFDRKLGMNARIYLHSKMKLLKTDLNS